MPTEATEEPGSPGSGPRRQHTGRRRNEAARQDIVDAALHLLEVADGTPVTVETIAAHAGVGKQTIYRWWPSKYALLLDVITERARIDVPSPDTGTLIGDLEAFLIATFRGASNRPTASFLRTMMAEAQRDPNVTAALQKFTDRRRQALREILARAGDRGETSPDADLDLITDQAYGLLWYRILIDHAPLTRQVAVRLAQALADQMRLPHLMARLTHSEGEIRGGPSRPVGPDDQKLRQVPQKPQRGQDQ